MDASPKRAAETFIAELQRVLPGRLHSAWLFGSVARGDAGPESAVDILVVLDYHDAATLREVYHVAERLSRSFDVDLSVKVFSDAEYGVERGSRFMTNVEREGVVLA